MSRLKEVLKNAQPITDEESRAATRLRSDFDDSEVFRMVLYRRAYQQKYLNDECANAPDITL